MSGLGVRIDVAGAVRDAAAEFERFAIDRFPRAVQFALTGVVIDAANAFRRDIPNIWDVPNRATRGALRYVVDRELLNRVTMVGEAQASVFVQDLPSIWLKDSFGNGPQTRTGGDVGVEAYFQDQMSVEVPVSSNLKHTGLGSPSAAGKVSSRDARNIGRLAAAGYTRNTGTAGATRGSARWGVFEIKPGEASRQGGYFMGPGIYARPPRVVAAVGWKKIAKAIKAGTRSAPMTRFTRASGQTVTVPKVVNADVPRLLFLSTPQAQLQPKATPSWARAMEAAAATMPDRLARELTDHLEHAARKGRRR